MTRTNLIPLPRREARRAKAAARRWFVIGAGYAVLVLAGLAGAAATWETDTSIFRHRLDDLTRGNSTLKKNAGELAAEYDQTNVKLVAAKAVSHQPDWSILLALIGRSLGDDAALRRLTLRSELAPPPETKVAAGTPAPASGKTEPPKATEEKIFILRLHAVARNAGAPTGVVLELERTGLFDEVKLVETRRETGGKTELIAFDVECRMGGRRR